MEGAEGHYSLCAQFEDGAVSHRVCLSGQKCSRKVRGVADALKVYQESVYVE